LSRSSLLPLLHLCDSLFPIGGYSCSDGLESATASGVIATPDDLREWIAITLAETVARSDGPTVWFAWTAFRDRQWDDLVRLDQEIIALRPSSTTRGASRAMGLRLVNTWQSLYPGSSLAHLASLAREGRVGPAWPVAFASACASSGIERRAAVEAFAYNRLAATISSAMRLMPVGQSTAHALLAEALSGVPAIADAIAARSRPAESFTPAMDLAAMSQQYLHSRLFRS
jgi:urease accessory protein